MAMLNPEGDLFWRNVWQGVRDGSDDAPYALSEYEYGFSAAAEENELLDIALRTNADGILLHPKDTLNTEFYARLAAAKQQGMKIVLIDGNISTEDYDVFVGIDNVKIGADIADYISNQFESDQRILVLLNENGLSSALQDRVNGFFSAVNEKSLSVEIYTMETSSNISQGLPDIQNFLLENKITYLIAFSSTTTLKAAGAVSMSGLAQEVNVIGFGENAEALQYVENKIIHVLFVQDSYQMGKKSAEIMGQLLSGKKTVPSENKIDVYPVTFHNVAEYIDKINNNELKSP